MINKSIKLKDIKIDDLFDIKKISYEEIPARDIAIIGINGKFASAGSIDEFYTCLRNGENLVGKFPESRKKDTDSILRLMGITEKETKYHGGAFLDEIDKFDCNLFNISPKEASLMDPNQRIFLQTAWNAIEDSGYGGDRLKGSRTGIYIGYCGDFNEDYKKYVQLVDPSMAALSVTGNIKSIVASRISYLLDLKGPSMLIDTACSSTLVAVHLACQALRNGECDTAIAGGIKIILLPEENNPNDGIGIDSSLGVTRAFDDYSDGTGFGEGVAAIVLKPLKKALEDRDNIYSIIKGSAVNQDGTSMGITAPNAEAQMDVITRAWNDAKIDPETIAYIEAHGTGTNLGDPVEIDGIEMAFSKYTNRKQFCCVSSVKTNIGHLDSAAGIASLIKAILSIKHRELFPSLHFVKPNKKIDFENSPVYINDTLKKWESDGVPRRCGISSFGLSGTNCHLILEEPPRANTTSREPEFSDYHIFSLSSKDKNCLMDELEDYRKYLNRVKEVSIRDICYTANTGRGHYNFRIAFIITNKKELKDMVEKIITGGLENTGKFGAYFGQHKVVNISKEVRKVNEYLEDEIATMSRQAEIYLKEVASNTGQKKKALLENICKFYVNGAIVQWDKFYENRQFAKVSLPGYSFMKKRCWIELDKVSSDSTLTTGYGKTVERNAKFDMEAAEDGNNTFYKLEWVKQAPETYVRDNEYNSGVTVIFNDKYGTGEELAQKLRALGTETVEVKLGSQYEETALNKYITGNSQSDFSRLLSRLKNKRVSRIIYMPALWFDYNMGIEGLDEVMERGVYCLHKLTKSIFENIRNDVDVVIIADYASEVVKNQKKINACSASLFAMGRVIGQEYENIKSRCIDIDKTSGSDSIITELGQKKRTFYVSYRNGERYIQNMGIQSLDSFNENRIEITEQGVYIIAGGFGGIGLEVCKYLASRKKVILVIINRSSLPERSLWDSILKNGHMEAERVDQKEISRIGAIKDIENMGSKVFYHNADISELDSLREIFAKVRKNYGNINGVINLAGVFEEGILIRKNTDSLKKVIVSKVNGTLVLDKLTEKDNLDFFVMFSSIASFIGGHGQGEYSAANAFMDSFAEYKSRYTKRVISINWTAWKQVGMASQYNLPDTGRIFKMISKENAINAFDRILVSDLSRVIIGEMDYDFVAGYAQDNEYIQFDEEIKNKLETYTKRFHEVKQPDIRNSIRPTGNQNQEYTPMEHRLATVWGAVLGLDEVDIYENLYNLGGDSIIALRIVNEINNKLSENIKIEIDINSLYEHCSISDLAKFIGEKYPKAVEEKPIESDTDKVRKNEDYIITNKNEINKVEIQNSTISQVSGLMWRQMNCLDRSFGLLIGQQNNELLRLFKLFIGIKRSYNLQKYFGDLYSKQSLHNGYPIENQLLQSFGLRICVKEADDLERIHSAICNSIDEGKPVLVCFDEYYIFYSSHYLNKHTKHLAVIDGYDRSRRLYSLIDYNHIINNESQKIDYGHFKTTFETMENIYSNINYNMEILIMEREQPADTNSLMRRFRGAVDYIVEKNLLSEDLVLINNIIDGQGSNLDTEGLNKLYFHLGSKELLLDTVVSSLTAYTKNLKGMAHNILKESSNLINICSMSVIRGKNISLDSTITKNVKCIYNDSIELLKALKNTDIIHN